MLAHVKQQVVQCLDVDRQRQQRVAVGQGNVRKARARDEPENRKKGQRNAEASEPTLARAHSESTENANFPVLRRIAKACAFEWSKKQISRRAA
jgi:hypothetical protein